MKKSIFMAAVLLVSAFGFAQKMNVVSLPGLDVQYKRCVVNGSTCYFDFLVTNTQNTAYYEIVEGANSQAGMAQFKLWDDEGNILDGSRYECFIGGKKTSSAHLPKDVPVKVRISFTNVDEYATMFTLFQIPISDGANRRGYIELRNIPIVRRDQ